MTKTADKKKKKFVKIVLPALIVLMAFFLLFLPSLMQSYLTGTLQKMGLQNPELTVRHVGINQLDIQHLSLGETGKPGLIIPNAAVDFTWIDLLKGKIGKIQITGMTLNVAAGKDGLIVKGLEPLFKNKSEGKTSLPFKQIDISSSVVQLEWEGKSLSIPFILSAINTGPGDSVRFALDLTPYGETITVRGTLNMESGAGTISITADNTHLERYFNDFNISFCQWLKSRVQLNAEVNVANWGIRDSHISLAMPGFSAGFPGGNVKGSVNLDFNLDRDLQPGDIRAKLRFDGIDEQSLKIEIPFDLDINGSQLNSLQFKLAELSLQQPPGMRFNDFTGTASLANGHLQVQGSYQCSIEPDLVSWLSPAMEMKGKLEFKGNVLVQTSEKGTDWNIEGKGGGKVLLTSKIARAAIENLALSFASTGKENTLKNHLEVKLMGVEIKYEDMIFSTANILSQNTFEKSDRSDAENWAVRGKLQMKSGQVKQKDGINAQGIRLDAPWQYPFNGSKGPNPGSWGIASLKLGTLDLGKIAGEIKQNKTGVEFSGDAQTPVEPLKLKVNGTFQYQEEQAGIDSVLQFVIPESQITRDAKLGKLHPALLGYRWSGYVSGSGTVAMLQGNLSSRAQLKLRDLEMESDTGGIKCQGMNTEIIFKDLLNFQTEISQRIDFKSVDVSGMQLNAGHLDFEVINAESIYIEGGEFAFSGGRILLQPLRYNLNGGDLKVTLYGDRINFSEIVNRLQGAKVAFGEAELNGMLTVGISGGIPVFRDGYLYSTPGVGGNIKFTQSEAISGGVLLVEEAVKDFNYDWIKLKINTNILNDKLNITAYINGVPAHKLPLTYDMKTKDIVRDKAGGNSLELKGLLLELRFNDLDLKRLMKGGLKIYSQEHNIP